MANTTTENNFNYFLNADFSEYKEGEWVAICHNRVIAHGQELKRVMTRAKKECSDRPLFTRVKKAASYLHG